MSARDVLAPADSRKNTRAVCPFTQANERGVKPKESTWSTGLPAATRSLAISGERGFSLHTTKAILCKKLSKTCYVAALDSTVEPAYKYTAYNNVLDIAMRPVATFCIGSREK